MTKFFRVGDKLLNRDKLDKIIDQIFNLRVSGISQKETAQRVGCDRSFISRLESLAEVRKGGTLAVIGFPLANVFEIKELCSSLGVEYSLLMNEQERWKLIKSLDGQSLLNWLMDIMMEMSDYDHVIMVGSDMRIKLAEAILGEKVFGVNIGKSPIDEDYYLNPDELRKLVVSIKGD